MIRFGSMVQIFLPKGFKPKVKKGQTVVAGETVILDLSDDSEENDSEESFLVK